MRMWKSFLAGAGIALFAACGSEPTSIGVAEQASLNHGGSYNVTIDGPTVVSVGSTCEWTAVVTGGTAPYAYLWMAWDLQDSFSATFVGTVNDTGTHTLYLEVTDAGNNFDSAVIGVMGTSDQSVGCGS